MDFAVVIIILLVLALIWKALSSKKKVTRRASADRDVHEASRVPVTEKCLCGMPRCRYKGKKHPPATIDEAPLRNRRKYHR